MFLYFGKILPLLLFPPALTIVLLVFVIVFRNRTPRLAAAAFVLSLLTLYLFSAPLFADLIQYDLESRYPAIPIDKAPQADAIVVLGGYLRSPSGEHRYAEFTESTDRLWMGAQLYRAGKAPLILLTGGNIGFLGGQAIPEAVAAHDLLLQWNVPDSVILVESASKTTHENATLSKPLLAAHNATRLLLVTSAIHMPRAMAIFRREGLNVTAIPTDYLSGWGNPDLIFRFIPDADDLFRSRMALHEWAGIAIYRMRGWL